MVHINDIVRFNKNHKWYGCIGIVKEARPCGDDIKYMVGVPVPQKGTAYIFTMESNNEIEPVCRVVLGWGGNNEDDG